MRLQSKGMAPSLIMSLEPRIVDDLGVHFVAMLARFEDDPREDDRLVGFRAC